MYLLSFFLLCISIQNVFPGKIWSCLFITTAWRNCRVCWSWNAAVGSGCGKDIILIFIIFNVRNDNGWYCISSWVRAIICIVCFRTSSFPIAVPTGSTFKFRGAVCDRILIIRVLNWENILLIWWWRVLVRRGGVCRVIFSWGRSSLSGRQSQVSSTRRG